MINQDFEDLEFPEDSEDLELSEDSEDLEFPEDFEDLEPLEQSFFERLLIQGIWDSWLNQTLGLYLALKDKKGFFEECQALKEVLQESWELVKAPDAPMDFEEIESSLQEIELPRQDSHSVRILAIHHKNK